MKVLDRQWVSKAPKLTHVPSFDGIRGIGIFGVMIGHSFPVDTLSFAAIVDIFFVISGFLITSLLLQEQRNEGRISLRKFYARRSLRLMPLLYVLLVVVAATALLFKVLDLLEPPYFLSDLAKESAASAVYIHNIVYPTLGGPWLAHLWTLSVEEQFYLVVGVVMMVVLVRGGIRVIAAALVFFILAIQISRGFGITGPFHELAFAVWLQRPDSLMIGVLGAIINARMPDPLSDRTKTVLRCMAWVGVVSIFVTVWASTTFARERLGFKMPFFPGDTNYLATNQDPAPIIQDLLNTPGWRIPFDRIYWVQWGFTVANWSFLMVTFAAFRLKGEWFPNRVTSWKPLVLVGGLLSYGLYLWHYPVQHFTRMIVGTQETGRVGDHYRMNLNPFLQVTLDIAITFMIAIPTYFWVEKKALKLKNRFQVEKSPPAGGVTPKTESPTASPTESPAAS